MKTLILVGGGHAHLHVLEKLNKTRITDVETILISPDQFQYYSGMFSGYVEGIYTREDIRIDLEKLTKRANITFLKDAVTAIDPIQKKVLTAKGEILEFDAISFDIGSLTAGTDLPGVKEYAYRIKPNYHFVNTIDEVRNNGKVVIVGGGAAGIEISLSLQAWRNENRINFPVTLISGGSLLENESGNHSQKIEEIILEKGIQVLTGKVVKVGQNEIWTSTGENILYDHIIWLAGPKAPGLFKASQLPIDQAGFLRVEETLQVKAYPSIFGAGDCVSMVGHQKFPKAGVYAVKQGPVLYKNIKGFFGSGIGQEFVPQKNALSILSLGKKEGFLLYKGLANRSYWAWVLKNKIDTHFVKKYQKSL